MKELVQNVVKWAGDKGILEKATLTSQFSKMKEEVLEVEECIQILESGVLIAPEVIEQYENNLTDEIGDVLVTAIILAKLAGYDAEDCLQQAYDKISKRTGNMINGTFVKDHY